MANRVADRYDPSQFNEEHCRVTEDGLLTVSKENSRLSVYPSFLPTWNPKQKFQNLEFFKHEDKGELAHIDLIYLFPKKGLYTIKSITPKFGTEVTGIQLSRLTDYGKDDLAALVSERGVAIFRDQDFADKGPGFAVNYGKYFGRLHIHQTSGSPAGFPELHVTFKGLPRGESGNTFSNRINNLLWHSDVSYELNPPHITFFTVLQGPKSGGDTIFANTVEAYKRLSPQMQKMLQGLHVLHTSEDQAHKNQKSGGIIRRSPASNVHPLVRQHPVTKEKFLFINREFSRKIVELKDEESNVLLEFLFKYIESSHDLQLRVNWEPNTVIVWDNRTTIHTALIDWDEPVIRHGFRIAVQGERPVEDLKYLNNETYLNHIYRLIPSLLNK